MIRLPRTSIPKPAKCRPDSEQGSVSIFAVIAVTILMVLNLVLIDLSRLRAAELATEEAGRAAARSLLAAYSSKLQDYALFGKTEDNSAEQATAGELFRKNLPQGSHAVIGADLQAAGVKVINRRNLADPSEFKHQILEAMKWQAPIAFTSQLAQTMGKLQQTSAAAKQQLKLSQAVQQDMDKRNQALKQAWDQELQMSAQLESWGEQDTSRIRSIAGLHAQLQALSEQAGSGTGSSGSGQAGQAAQAAAAQARAQAIEAVQRNLQLAVQSLRDADSRDYQALLPMQSTVAGQLEKANHWNRIMKDALQQWSTAVPTADTGAAPNAAGANLVIGTDEFVRMSTELAAAIARFGAYMNVAEGDGIWNGQAVAAIEACSRQAASWAADVRSRLNRLQETESGLQRQEQHLGDQTQQSLNRAKEAVLPEACSGNDPNHYGQLRIYEADYSNRPASAASPPAFPQDVQQYGSRSISLLGGIAQAAQASRDKLYVIEYALGRFNYRTYAADVQSGAVNSDAPSNPSGHPLPAQEAEYLLYGLGSCHANLWAAYSEIYALRFAVRMAEALRNPEIMAAAASPLIGVLTAMAAAAKAAYTDCANLLKGKRVEISAYLPNLSFGYRDYLRLLFFVQGREQGLLTRVMALITLDTGIDLHKAATEVEIRAASGLPLLIWAPDRGGSALHFAQYKIRKTVVYGY